MKCPFCKSEDVRVIDTRKYDTCILRVRLCEKCHMSFQTAETCDVSPEMVKKLLFTPQNS